MTVTLADIEAAAARIEGAVRKTPLDHARTLSEICGATLVLKFENLQYTASFKERGALNKLLGLDDAAREAGVIAVSAGNHAQGVAYHAQRLGIPATIVMPRATPFTKIRQTEVFGATVELFGDDLSEAAAHAESLKSERGLTWIHPYDDAAIIAGQGTVGLEMLASDPDLEVLVVPIGGGGLIAGVATAAKALAPGIEVIGVESDLYPAMSQVLKGAPPEAGGTTIAEGIAVKQPGRITREIIRDTVDDIILVPDDAIEQAVLMLIEIEKTVAEGAGAAALAAVLREPERFAGRRVGLVISGGNIDSRLLSAILMRGLVRNKRLVRLRIDISDQPGLLGRVAQIIGDAGGNIVEVYHQRLFHNVPLKMAELDVVVETRDPDHVQRILDAVRGAGHEAHLLSSDSGAEIA
ncbi:MAG: threonine ammonia-lyase [Bauldia litoralis]